MRSDSVGAIEINATFYGRQSARSWQKWSETVPEGFQFTIKGSRYCVMKTRLAEAVEGLSGFFAQGFAALGPKLGPILWQFASRRKFDRDDVAGFIDLLPNDVEGIPLRHAIEIRHTSFCDPSFIELLREHQIALVIAETAKRFPMMHDITADFVYMRLHGDKELYRSGYSDRALERWAKRISAWHRGSELRSTQKISKHKPPTSKPRDVYCYFDNTDVKLRAPVDAQTLIRKLRQ